MFTRKPKFLPLTQSKNYSFVVSSDKISKNNKKIYLLKFSNYLRISKHPQNICMVIKKKVDLNCQKYDKLLNIDFF